jgi:lysophospholipid acyltransferase (LPLAT)-like uncharacterized protein
VNSAFDNAAGLVLGHYARLLGASLRQQVIGGEHLDQALASGRSIVFASWHGQTHLLYPLIHGRLDMSKMVMMVVGDARAGVLQRFAKTVGIAAYPVASEDQSMAGARNFLRLAQLLREGRYSFMTPDGPNGPARVAKEGVAFLAERAEALVVALGGFGRYCYRIRRWDRYALPLPFSRIFASVRPPITLARGGDREEFLRALSIELDAAVEEAHRAGGE